MESDCNTANGGIVTTLRSSKSISEASVHVHLNTILSAVAQPDSNDVETENSQSNYRSSFDSTTLARIQRVSANRDIFVQTIPSTPAKLGIFSTGCLIINRVIGTGIFEAQRAVWIGTESVAGAMMMWIIGGIVAMAGMMVYLELGLSVPRYLVGNLEFLYQRPKLLATYIYGVIFLFLGNTAGNGITLARCILKLRYYPHHLDISDVFTGWLLKSIALIIITVVCLLHGVWRAGGIYVNNFFATIKIGILLFFILAGLAAYIRGRVRTGEHPGLELRPDRIFVNQGLVGGGGVHGWVATLLDVCFSYAGFENAHYVLSEIKDPQRTFKWSALFAVVAADDLIKNPNDAMSDIFARKVFGDNASAHKAILIMVAISAFGNIVVTTFIASKVKQEIAKEGILPFSFFWRKDYTSTFTRLFRKDNIELYRDYNQPVGYPLGNLESPQGSHHNPSVSTDPRSYNVTDQAPMQPLTPRKYEQYPGIPPEKAPVPALFLHWLTSVILVVAPPARQTYSLLACLYVYMIHAWLGMFLSAGLLYVGYYKQWVADRERAQYARHSAINSTSPPLPPPTQYNWRAIAGFRPPLGPIFPVIHFLSSTSIVIGAWIPHKNGQVTTGTTVRWWLAPTLGVGLLLLGSEQDSILDREECFRYEEVKVVWLPEEAEEEEEEEVREDPELQW
ncbi:amino acid permease-domain-containing protein [Kalaharituber pfeilii]|nr:amino acid permease-domain-containing protein [Kalaharituber pfeilii]